MKKLSNICKNFLYVSIGIVTILYAKPGDIDQDFGTNGIVYMDLQGDEIVNRIAIQNDGKILVSTVSYSNLNNGFLKSSLIRYNKDGSMDDAFGFGGYISNSEGYYENFAIQNDGKIVVVGQTADRNDTLVVRYNRNGSFDTSFGNNGSIVTDAGNGKKDKADGVAIQKDDKIVVCGSSVNDNNDSDFMLVRYNVDGTIDMSFGENGVVRTGIEEGSYDYLIIEGKISTKSWGVLEIFRKEPLKLS